MTNKKTGFALSVLIFGLILGLAFWSQAQAEKILISNITLIDGTGQKAKPGSYVLITGDPGKAVQARSSA